MRAALGFVARHGRYSLIAGLVLGLTAQPLADALRPHLAEMVALLLFLSALRIGATAAVGGLGDLRRSVWLAAIFQIGAPVAAILLMSLAGVATTPAALALTLMLAAPSISGAPNFCAMLGLDPAPALRILLVGTLLAPLTVLPVFWLSPALDDPLEVVLAALRLVAVIGGAVALAFAFRALLWRQPTAEGRAALDGVSAILLGVIVIGLMSPLGAALETAPASVLWWLGFVLAANFGLQILAFLAISRSAWSRLTVPVSMIAGNRNVALFLVALPDETLAPVLIFIGCYQIPMYLTPIVMSRLYRRHAAAAASEV